MRSLELPTFRWRRLPGELRPCLPPPRLFFFLPHLMLSTYFSFRRPHRRYLLSTDFYRRSIAIRALELYRYRSPGCVSRRASPPSLPPHPPFCSKRKQKKRKSRLGQAHFFSFFLLLLFQCDLAVFLDYHNTIVTYFAWR